MSISRVGDRVGIGAPISSGHHIRQGGFGLSFRLILSHSAVILHRQHREYRDVHPIYTKTSMFTIRGRGTTEVKGVSLIYSISGHGRLTQENKINFQTHSNLTPSLRYDYNSFPYRNKSQKISKKIQTTRKRVPMKKPALLQSRLNRRESFAKL